MSRFLRQEGVFVGHHQVVLTSNFYRKLGATDLILMIFLKGGVPKQKIPNLSDVFLLFP